MFNKRMITVVSLSALTLLLSACEPAAQPNAERYADNGDGTVTDIQTSLTWQRCIVGFTWTGETCKGSWIDAGIDFKWDEAMELAKDGWRLPTVDELDTLVFCSSGKRKPSARPNNLYVDKTNGECQGDYTPPLIIQSAFPNSPTGIFWSSSPIAGRPGSMWVVSFTDGAVRFHNGKPYGAQVRLVRAGQ